MEARTHLVQLETGSIDSVWNGSFLRLEFNADCLDALRVCHAACCRNRSGFSVELDEDELDKYETRPHPMNSAIRLLQVKPDTRACIYLDEVDSKCTIHEHRPRMCRAWACSPHCCSTDEEVQVRDAGWILEPMRREELSFLQSR